jgi:rhamnose utilization protein RhaD (predicted bifunctional aldolase and dehydrogenase)
MRPEWNPASVGPELLALTRRLGEPSLDAVILAEGNTSELAAPGRVTVKTSGTYMAGATTADFVTVDVAELVAMIEDPATTQAQLTTALDAGIQGSTRRRGSIETLIHVSVRAFAPARFVAHTHPTAVISLLASKYAEEAFETAAYSDEAVLLGNPLYVPYAPPGLELGRLFHRRLRDRMEAAGELPSLILLGNHGLVAVSQTTAGAEAISLMAIKAARVRLGAYAVGGLAGLDRSHVDDYLEREDFSERHGMLSGAES